MAAEEIERLVLTTVSKAPPRGFTRDEIAEKTGLTRQTVSKYVYALAKNKELGTEMVGGLLLVFPIKGGDL